MSLGFYVSELNLQRTRLRPLAVGTELDRADDGRKRRFMHMRCDFALIEAADGGYRLPQNLQVRVCVWRQVVPQRVDTLALGFFLIFFQEGVDAREVKGRFRDPEIVIDDAVQHRSQVFLDGGELQADHAAAEHFRLQTQLVGRLDHSNRSWRVGADIDQIGTRGFDGPNDGRKVCRAGRIGLVVDDFQAHFLGVFPRTGDRVAGEFSIRRKQCDGFRFRALFGGDREESSRPILFRGRARRHDLEITVVVEFIVDREAEQCREHQFLAHHNRHRRRNFVGAVTGNDQVHFVDVQQLGIDARHFCRLCRIVVIDELHLPSQQTARLIRVFAPDFHGDKRCFPGARKTAGQRHAEADLKRLRSARSGRKR